MLERSSPRCLTEPEPIPTVNLSGKRCGLCATDPESSSLSDFYEFDLHSRDVYVLVSVRHDAGVYLGQNSEAISEPRRPTRQMARWVFSFAVHSVPESLKGTGGEVVNARVCKTRTRGFDSRPVLQRFENDCSV
jgi:hypothetical protein